MKFATLARNFALVSTLLLAPQFAHAYFVASLNGASIDPSKPTHVLVSGRGQNLGRQVQISALGDAARIRQAHPEVQIVLISVFEDASNRTDLEAKGIKILKANESVPFNTSSSMPELLKFTKIDSLQFYGHNSPSLGTQTDGPGQRFDFREGQVAKLAGHFNTNGYVFIHGCNAGWLIAPMISKLLKVPAAGAFTETHFERLNADDNFYVADKAQVPNLNWARNNAVSFNEPRACASGGCLRMRPANKPYNGHWGDLSNGSLGFYKFFCETDSQDHCDKVMAISLINSLTNANMNLVAAAKDMVCPSSKDRALSNDCAKAMDAALAGGSRAYTSLSRAHAIQCDFKSCAVDFKCTSTGGPEGVGECTINRTTNQASTTQADEFMAYIRGFKQLASK